jgi:hypothetical protein
VGLGRRARLTWPPRHDPGECLLGVRLDPGGPHNAAYLLAATFEQCVAHVQTRTGLSRLLIIWVS